MALFQFYDLALLSMTFINEILNVTNSTKSENPPNLHPSLILKKDFT